MTIDINLYRDCVDFVNFRIASLKRQGFVFDDFESGKKNRIPQKGQSLDQAFRTHQFLSYLNLEHRLVTSRPRSIMYAKKYSTPPILKHGVSLLEKKIRSGESLFPHLSRQIFRATGQDGMLFDWGIHHLHLGTRPDSKRPQLIQGGPLILFAVFSGDIAYFLTITDHNQWTHKSILKIVVDNFPHLVKDYEISGIIQPGTRISESERAELRQASVNTITEIDGNFYFPPGGGFNSAGTSMMVVPRAQSIVAWYDRAEQLIQEELPRMIERTNLSIHRAQNDFP